MHARNEPLISIQREWNDWRTAQVPLSALQNVHWFQPSGAPRPLVHGFVSCGDLLTGTIPHECEGTPSHRLRVCVLKCHTAQDVYADIARRADEQRVAEQELTAAEPQPIV